MKFLAIEREARELVTVIVIGTDIRGVSSSKRNNEIINYFPSYQEKRLKIKNQIFNLFISCALYIKYLLYDVFYFYD